MRIFLIDNNSDVVDACEKAFAGMPDVSVIHGDIFEYAHNAIVSPANTLGVMDGGIDRLYRDYFGAALEEQLMGYYSELQAQQGYVTAGQSVLLPTHNDSIPYLIASPTLVGAKDGATPQDVYYAMLGVLSVAHRHQEKVTDLFMPGLGTGVGMLAPELAAREMAQCLRDWRARIPEI